MRSDPYDTDIVFAQGPDSMIKRLLPVITTDRTIANYVNDHFGTKMPAAYVAKIRALQPKVVMTDHGPAIADASNKVEAAAKDSADRLLRAIRHYHPDKAA